jgi:glycosyltransferase involved in cell wall biosynthesis
MIVRNAADTLGRCLDSVAGIADELVIVDTGSSDGTQELILRYTPDFHTFAWIDDFAAARNESFDRAKMDYVLWLDADDVLLEEDRHKLMRLKRELDPDTDSVTMLYHYAFDEFGIPSLSLRRNRLVKRSRQFHWIGAVHEYLDVSGRILNSDIAVTHTRKHAQSGRNLAIFERRLARGEPFSPRDMVYYANELADNGQNERAASVYESFLRQDEGWTEDRLSACFRLAQTYGKLDRPGDKLKAVFRSFAIDVPRAEHLNLLGDHFLLQGDFPTAKYWFEQATRLAKPQMCWGFMHDAYWTWYPHLQLCVCCYKLGDVAASFEHNERARRYRPQDPIILANQSLLEGKLADENR